MTKNARKTLRNKIRRVKKRHNRTLKNRKRIKSSQQKRKGG